MTREKTNGLTKERRQIISPLLAGSSLYFYLFLFCGWAAELSALLAMFNINATSPRDAGNRVGRCCVYGFVTAGFRKMKLLVQTAAPLTAPVKSQGMLHCLDVNHFLQPPRKGRLTLSYICIPIRTAAQRPRAGQGRAYDASLSSSLRLL